jgi:hypothetical protein
VMLRVLWTPPAEKDLRCIASKRRNALSTPSIASQQPEPATSVTSLQQHLLSTAYASAAGGCASTAMPGGQGGCGGDSGAALSGGRGAALGGEAEVSPRAPGGRTAGGAQGLRGSEAGSSEITLRRAKAREGVCVQKVGFKNGAKWLWSIPSITRRQS